MDFLWTDHDTVDGIPEILAMDLPDDLKFIPGIEISCDALHREIRVLGYGINYKDQQLNQTLNMLRDKRFMRKSWYDRTLSKRRLSDHSLKNCKMVILILWSHELNFARTLIAEGICSSMNQAFSKYLGEKCKYYVPKPFFDPKDCLRLILDAGGIPVLAHPFLYKFSNEDTKTSHSWSEKKKGSQESKFIILPIISARSQNFANGRKNMIFLQLEDQTSMERINQISKLEPDADRYLSQIIWLMIWWIIIKKQKRSEIQILFSVSDSFFWSNIHLIL